MKPVSVAAARAAVIAAARVQPAVRMPLANAVGHLLAEDAIARWPLPRWTASSMDGWAVHSADLDRVGAVLEVAGGGDAGDAEPPPLQRGTAWRVATGGRVPDGADTVIRQEDVGPAGAVGAPLAARFSPNDTIIIHSLRDLRRNVRPVGGDVAEGSVAIAADTKITPGVIALLASLGHSTPMVRRQPRVAILSSGNEVVPLDNLDQVVSGDRIPDANTPMLSALVSQCGAVPVPLGLVADDPGAIAEAVRSARDVDLVITAGGISVGIHDHVPAAMTMLDAELKFRRVRIRPGGPTTLAVLPDGRPWLALPGNPVSAFVTFMVFGRIVLGSEKARKRESERAVLGETVARDPVLDLYLRVTLESVAGAALPSARLTGNQGSWVTSSIARADALAVIEAGDGVVEAGSVVEVLVIDAA